MMESRTETKQGGNQAMTETFFAKSIKAEKEQVALETLYSEQESFFYQDYEKEEN